MTLPTIHLNGTGREALVKQNADVSYAIDAAIKLAGEAAPHGRDYYPQGNGEPYPPAFQMARAEHEDRLRRLIALRQEFIDLAVAIQEAP